MKILFIYILPPKNVCYTEYNSGIASLSAVLKQEDYQTDLLFLYEFNKNYINAHIEKSRPDIIGYSFGSHQFSLAQEIIAYLADYCQVPAIVGGVHATIAPEECLNIKGVLGVCVGEAEEAFVCFVNAYAEGSDFFDTQNFYFKKNEKIISNSLLPLNKNLDLLPFPDRKIFNYDPNEVMLGLEFLFSRGCPYTCSFCINPHLQKLYKDKGPFIRFRTPGSAVREIEETLKLYNYQGAITFHDDVFTQKKSWLKEFSALYKEKVGLPYVCNSTADKIDDEVVLYLKDSGCREVWVGIETGDEKLRNQLLNKKVLDKDILNAGKTLKNSGIPLVSYNLIGIPGESEDNIKKLVDINIKAGVEKTSVSFLQPYPGTKLYEECLKSKEPRASARGIKNLNPFA